jgi:transglutaminase-like putative cysteine protease
VRLETIPALPHRLAVEEEFGNQIAYFEAGESGELPGAIEVRLSFDVERKEVSENRDEPVSDADAASLLEGDKLAPITDEVRKRTEEAIAGKETTTEKARAIYDRVLADMVYDKSGQGWGRGDIQHACDVGTGNCSDFHALFITMARAAGIPAYFEIGYPLPVDKTEGEIGGYHCWGWYQDEAGVWHPVDASEADKDPTKTDYFFGTLCCNRVALTKGRDLVIDPAPASPNGPVNFLVYPIIEIDGKRRNSLSYKCV